MKWFWTGVKWQILSIFHEYHKFCSTVKNMLCHIFKKNIDHNQKIFISAIGVILHLVIIDLISWHIEIHCFPQYQEFFVCYWSAFVIVLNTMLLAWYRHNYNSLKSWTIISEKKGSLIVLEFWSPLYSENNEQIKFRPIVWLLYSNAN